MFSNNNGETIYQVTNKYVIPLGFDGFFSMHKYDPETEGPSYIKTIQFPINANDFKVHPNADVAVFDITKLIIDPFSIILPTKTFQPLDT